MLTLTAEQARALSNGKRVNTWHPFELDADETYKFDPLADQHFGVKDNDWTEWRNIRKLEAPFSEGAVVAVKESFWWAMIEPVDGGQEYDFYLRYKSDMD